MSSYGSETTTNEVVKGVDLSGRVAIVTGASGGLGAETARALAACGAKVTIAARDMEKAESAAAEIRSSTGNPDVDVLGLELTVPESVRDFAKQWLATHDELHLLINNAGLMASPLERTREGWEYQFATNHLGHFLLTCLLAPALVRGAPSRVVNLSSAGHRMSPVVFDDIHFESRPYDKWESYGQSKTANILFSVALTARLAAKGVTANAVHPGMIMTELGRHMGQQDLEDLMSKRPAADTEMKWKSVEAGAATSLWGATAAELEGRGGLYLEDCGVAKAKRTDEEMEGYAAYALDADAAERLWRVSEETLGAVFDFNNL